MKLTVKLFIQGFYIGSGLMRSAINNAGFRGNETDCDIIDVEFWPDNATKPAITLAGMLKTNGVCEMDVPESFDNTTGYLAVRHRNAIETWSGSQITFNGDTTHDFTTDKSQAYGDNQVDLGGGVWGIYSGDVSKDENAAIESADYDAINDAIGNKGYVVENITGEASVTSAALTLIEANLSGATIFVQRPI